MSACLTPPPPDTGRVIVHLDADGFYAQCEELLDPSLRGRPLGVTQKYLVVTCNYVAREFGVRKLMGIQEAQRLCPNLVLASGEDLGPYRAASRRMLEVASRFGPAELLGLDELFVDVGAEVEGRAAVCAAGLHARAATLGVIPAGPSEAAYVGHVHRAGQRVEADSRHRVQDLRAVPCIPPPAGDAAPENEESGTGWQARLAAGSRLALEIRAAIKAEAGIRTSAGVACNKVLAKLVSGLHKPDDQTILLPPEAAAFVSPLPVRALPGIGHKMEAQLQEMGVHSAEALRSIPLHILVDTFGERLARMLSRLCWGKDDTPVTVRGPTKAVSVEDSFKSCDSWQGVERVLAVLTPDLLARLHEEAHEHGRFAETLTVKYRSRESWAHRPSQSCRLPSEAFDPGLDAAAQAGSLAAAALRTLRGSLTPPFDLTLINLSGTGFRASSTGHSSIAAYLRRSPPARPPEPGPAAPSALGRGAALAAAASRRDYGGMEGRGRALPPPTSKSQERCARDLTARAAGRGAAAFDPVPIPAGAGSGAGHMPGAATGRGAGLDWGEEGPAETDDFWEGLVGSGGMSRSAPAPLQPGLGPGAVNSGASAETTLGGGARDLGEPPEAARCGGAASDLSPPGAATDGETAGARCPAPARDQLILHCDVDSFYCAVERLDDPGLCAVPLAVTQFNGGGFVAVSYEARAAGIRCGDGAGPGARQGVPWLKAMEAASADTCRARCPGLVIRPMRVDRYRQVADQVLETLRGLWPGVAVEKASYDDFYLDISGVPESAKVVGSPVDLESQAATAAPFPPHLKAVAGQGAEARSFTQDLWTALAPDLRRGVVQAQHAQRAVQSAVGLTVSCGVARSKLAARLASPLAKPHGLTVVPDNVAVAFVRSQPLSSIPGLKGKRGAEVCSQLGVQAVADLASIPRARLVSLFGEDRGAFLEALGAGQDPRPVVPRGPQRSLVVERSFPPASPGSDAAHAALRELAAQAAARACAHAAKTGCLPRRAFLAWRAGYESGCLRRGFPVAPTLLAHLRRGVGDPERRAELALAQAAASVLATQCRAPERELLTLGGAALVDGAAGLLASAAPGERDSLALALALQREELAWRGSGGSVGPRPGTVPGRAKRARPAAGPLDAFFIRRSQTR
ncbi:hypothetical protein APUTEX25_002379 [Auxenochlorella protothecoides]|uniref:DNA polymerase eta n=1 Tax=Auxenochlorella protothecoides TaxID=3075 RepID=A0A3M7L1X3_AUXPR|nr:hypothetical protein APUTEX25_002379 [Auxenochlorella protothecoides]|eukprot:RMZ56189.1 hypothetical protein APUTEX25_002379 [Auxenochlorella protothecoides]